MINYIECNLEPESFQVCEKPTFDLYQTDDKIGIFSFFSGAGFLDLGFETQGKYAIRFVNEYNLPFMQTYRFSRINMGIAEPTYGYSLADIEWMLEGKFLKKLKNLVEIEKRKGQPVGFIGGPPCPDFSVGGKNKGQHGENGKLTNTYIELVCLLKPDFFLFENVKGLYRTVKHRQFFEEMKVKLENAGYLLTERLTNALWYGAPQDRERILLIGFNQKSDRLNNITSQSIAQFPWSLTERNDSQTLKDLPWPEQTPFAEGSRLSQPDNLPIELTVEYWFQKNSVENHPNFIHCFTPRAGLKKFQVIQEGDDKKKSYKRLHRWRYSPTAAYGNNEVHLHPYHARRLNVAETLAIQSLPKEFIVPPTIPLSAMFKTVGNGVPYMLSKAIAESISSFISTTGAH